MNRHYIVLLSLVSCLLDSTARAEETVAMWYVSPEGNDTWSGRLEAPNADETDGPLATLERTVAASRQAGIEPRRIALLPGEYAWDLTYGGRLQLPTKL